MFKTGNYKFFRLQYATIYVKLINEGIMQSQSNSKQSSQVINPGQTPKRKMSRKIKIITIICVTIGLLLGYLVFAFVASRMAADDCACSDECDGVFPFTPVEGSCGERRGGSSGGPVPVYKPIIYLYPKEDTSISLKLKNPDLVTVSYPKYVNGWEVQAHPDGTLTDLSSGRELYSLYWEGKDGNYGMTDEGFVVEGDRTAEFLEEKLEILGLNARESEEFIIYWLPQLQYNKYNYIRFASMDEINDYMALDVSPQPNTIIRVLMLYKPLEKAIDVNEQQLNSAPSRDGFTLVEWGGSKLE